MAKQAIQARVGLALVEFASNGAFPNEEDISAAPADAPALSAAREALEAAQTELEVLPTCPYTETQN